MKTTDNPKELFENYNYIVSTAWEAIERELDLAGFGIGDIITDRQGDKYKITHREPKTYKFGESDRTFSVSFLGVKLLKATGTFGQYTHYIIF